MKKLVVRVLIILAVLVAGGFLVVAILSEDKPAAVSGKEGDIAALNMMMNLNYPGWQKTQFIAWTFPGEHHYVWNKAEDKVCVSWDENVVVLNTQNQKGKAIRNDVVLTGEEANELLQEAWAKFCNDSFWLCAPYKAMDAGTKRSVVKDDAGRENVLVEYTSGGVTPGDSYLWILGEDGTPTAWKMWVSNLPVKGMEATWEDYVELYSGARLASKHKMGPVTLELTNIRAAKTAEELGIDEKLFDGI